MSGTRSLKLAHAVAMKLSSSAKPERSADVSPIGHITTRFPAAVYDFTALMEKKIPLPLCAGRSQIKIPSRRALLVFSFLSF